MITNGREWVDLDYDEEMASAEPHACVTVDSQHPLYLLYTSGTTGYSSLILDIFVCGSFSCLP